MSNESYPTLSIEGPEKYSVIGVDSNGEVVKAGDSLWAVAGNRAILIGSADRELFEWATQQTVVKSAAEHFPSKDFEVVVAPPSDWVTLEQLPGHKFEMENISINIRSIRVEDNAHILRLRDGKAEYDLTVPFGAAFNIPGSDKNYLILTVAAVETLVPFDVSALNTKPGEIFPPERLDSHEAVLERLQTDFPWIKPEDLEDMGLLGARFNIQSIYDSRMGSVDFRRFINIYPGGLNDEPNEFERKYILGRDYARFCQFVQLVTHPDLALKDLANSEKNVQQLLYGISVEDRRKDNSEFISKVEWKIFYLLKPRWDLEKHLFGETHKDPFRQYILRFTSQESYPALAGYAGIYVRGILGLAMRPEVLFDGLSSFEVNDITQIARNRITDLLSHEIGHEDYDTGAQLTRYSTTSHSRSLYGDTANALEIKNPCVRTEVWNQWKSVILPKSLHDPEDSLSIRSINYSMYDLAAEDYLATGGALGIDTMVSTLITYAKTHPEIVFRGKRLTTDLVLSSALATAFTGIETGNVKLDISSETFPGFADLYNVYANATSTPTFEKLMATSTDEAYKQASRKARYKDVGPVESKELIMAKTLGTEVLAQIQDKYANHMS